MGRGTWDMGRGDSWTRGLGDAGMCEPVTWDAGSRGLGDVVCENFGTRRRAK